MTTESHDANFLYINMIEINMGSFGFLLFLFVVTLFGLKIETIRATNKIRKKLVDMGYSPTETESLTKGIISVLKEEKELGPNPSPDWSKLYPNLLKSYVGWTRFT